MAAELTVLREHATGRLHHLNRGLCPDEIAGHDSRDPDCQVCRALATQQATQGAEPVATLHDDGCYTFKRGKEPHGARYAGWRLDVYTAPPPTAEALAAIEAARVEARAKALEERNEALLDTFEKVRQWSLAYPEEAFPKPDLVKARQALEGADITLDSVSAYAMRHVITKVWAMLEPHAASMSPAPAAGGREGVR